MFKKNKINYLSYYENAFYADYDSVWRFSPFGNTTDDIKNMSYYRAIGCFYQDDEQSLIDRRELLFNYLKADFDTTKTDSALVRYRYRLPIDSAITRILRNICTAYSSEARRNFGKINDKLQEIYSESKIDAYLKDIYKQAKLYGLVAVRPIWVNNKLKLQVLTPDRFRVIANEKDPRQAEALVYPIYNAETQLYEFHYWDSEFYRVLNNKKIIIKEEPNKYGLIPFAFLRFGYSDGDSLFYTSGMFQNIERQLLLNKVKFMQMLNLTFQGLPIAVSTNSDGQLRTVTPDKVISIEGVDGSESTDLPPSLEFVSPPETYMTFEEFLKLRENKLLKDNGIPLSSIEASGTINSGISRMIERQELLEMRQDDLPILREFEKTLAEIITISTCSDGQDVSINIDSLEFAVDFEEERLFLEPEVEREADKARAKEGLLHPINYFQKWGDFDNNITEQSLIKEIKYRKELFNTLFTNNELSPDGRDQSTGAEPSVNDGSEPDGDDEAEPIVG